MNEKEIGELIGIGVFLIIIIPLVWQFYRFTKIVDEENDAWNKLQKRLDELGNH